MAGGKDKEVTEENKAEYLQLFTQHRLLDAIRPVRSQKVRVLVYAARTLKGARGYNFQDMVLFCILLGTARFTRTRRGPIYELRW